MTLRCFHCDLPADDRYFAQIEGQQRAFCCLGCQAVACAIADSGLAAFYRFRDTANVKVEHKTTVFDHYDNPDFRAGFVRPLEGDGTNTKSGEQSEALLAISGLSCAACAWLVEHHLDKLAGTVHVNVNVTNALCRVVWDDKITPLSAIMAAIYAIGYEARPHHQSQQQLARKRSHRAMLGRLGIAGIGMMQVGMFAIALHAGAIQGMDEQWQHFFRWISLLVATPVVFYAAQPFFSKALRSVRHGRPGMDVPVALAIGMAYVASFWATVINTGEVYFDSISMFTFFLLLGRFLEMKVRHSSFFVAENFSQLLPDIAARVVNNNIEMTPLSMLKHGDMVQVAAGEVIPCDGALSEGDAWVNEMLISGESEPQTKTTGSHVWAGTINGDTPLHLKVSATGAQTKLASVERIVNRALSDKPQKVVLADKLSRYFIIFVLLAASSSAAMWTYLAPEKAMWVALSVLVVSCPCALSLATPAALTAAALHLKKLGVLVTSGAFVEKLMDVNHVVFDKTGTLTQGKLAVAEITVLSDTASDITQPYQQALSALDISVEDTQKKQHGGEITGVTERILLGIIAALEANSNHPIASAFDKHSLNLRAHAIKVVAANGIEGLIDGKRYRFGRKEFASPHNSYDYPGLGLWQLLSCDEQALAWVRLQDAARHDIAPCLTALNKANIGYEILSGDRLDNVAAFAQAHGIDTFRGGVDPATKLEHIRNLQAQGKNVLMIGDGINDVPSLAGAALSLAVGHSTQLAQSHADAILLSENLTAIAEALAYGHTVQRVIKQNLGWALAYNLIALPAATMGLIPPYLAAIGMSLSSLVVVMNSLRLNFSKSPPKAWYFDRSHAHMSSSPQLAPVLAQTAAASTFTAKAAATQTGSGNG